MRTYAVRGKKRLEELVSFLTEAQNLVLGLGRRAFGRASDKRVEICLREYG